MSKAVFRKEGDWYIFTWPDIGYGLGFDQLRDHSYELSAEVTVQTLAGVEGKTHIHWAKLNLSSTQARDRLAKKLSGQTQIAESQWNQMIEYACVTTGREYRRGDAVIDLSQDDEVGKVEYLVDKILPIGEPCILAGDGDSCKSFFALAVGMAVAQGFNLPAGIHPTRQTSVLYLDWESTRLEMRRRMGWLARGLHLEVYPHIFYRRMTRSLADDVSHIRREIDRNGIGLVILDSVALATGGEPKETEPVLALMGALRTLAPVTSLLIAHVSKEVAQQTGSKRGRVYGSVFYENLARTVWEVRAEPAEECHAVAFFHRKVNVGKRFSPFGLQLRFDDNLLATTIEAIELEDVPELAEHATIGQRIKAILKRGRLTTDQLAVRLDAKPDSIRKTLNRMEGRGELVSFAPSTGEAGRAQIWGLRA